ncbi:MAG: decaprenylphospho-beta-D-erythro-pentofuranosid-2-ulose 2-reductase [Paracoccaceae bacterium]
MTHKIVIIGATSGIAEHCARLWAMQGAKEFLLIGRSKVRLDRIATDLSVRLGGVLPKVITHGDLTPAECTTLITAARKDGPPDIVLIAHGFLPDQKACQGNLANLEAALLVNGQSVCLLAEGFAAHMQDGAVRSIVILGSVAGDRGRKSNYAYGAAKGLVERFAQGLQHRLSHKKSALIVTLVKPGPTATAMTAHLEQKKLAKPEDVSAQIIKAVKARRLVVYAPAKWALIMMVIRHLPSFIFHKIDF